MTAYDHILWACAHHWLQGLQTEYGLTEDGLAEYGVAEYKVTREGKKQYQISSKIYMTADEATYDRWRKRLKL